VSEPIDLAARRHAREEEGAQLAEFARLLSPSESTELLSAFFSGDEARLARAQNAITERLRNQSTRTAIDQLAETTRQIQEQFGLMPPERK
jgi:hypothetical protein